MRAGIPRTFYDSLVLATTVNVTLLGVACVVVIVCGLVWLFGRRHR